ncbi:hypothetical protein D3C87_2055580 [compost metagenome]
MVRPRIVREIAMESEIVGDDPAVAFGVETEFAGKHMADDIDGSRDEARIGQRLGQSVMVFGVVAPSRRGVQRDNEP